MAFFKKTDFLTPLDRKTIDVVNKLSEARANLMEAIKALYIAEQAKTFCCSGENIYLALAEPQIKGFEKWRDDAVIEYNIARRAYNAVIDEQGERKETADWSHDDRNAFEIMFITLKHLYNF